MISWVIWMWGVGLFQAVLLSQWVKAAEQKGTWFPFVPQLMTSERTKMPETASRKPVPERSWDSPQTTVSWSYLTFSQQLTTGSFNCRVCHLNAAPVCFSLLQSSAQYEKFSFLLKSLASQENLGEESVTIPDNGRVVSEAKTWGLLFRLSIISNGVHLFSGE